MRHTLRSESPISAVRSKSPPQPYQFPAYKNPYSFGGIFDKKSSDVGKRSDDLTLREEASSDANDASRTGSGNGAQGTEHTSGRKFNYAGEDEKGSDEKSGKKSKKQEKESDRDDGKIELTEDDCYDELGFGFSSLKKWTILTVIFIVQVSMNFNSSLYSNGIGGISKQFHVSEQAARVGAAIFLVAYAFGCELWAPWSEELGRKPILQASLLLVNIWQIPVALAPNFGTIIVGRFLGGISSAGGSVTLGMIADMWDSDTQQYAVAYVVFSSVGGSVLGPVVGGFVQQFLSWQWTIWIQLIFGVAVQILHLILVPETRSTIMIDRIAKKRRAKGENV